MQYAVEENKNGKVRKRLQSQRKTRRSPAQSQRVYDPTLRRWSLILPRPQARYLRQEIQKD